MFTSSVRMLFIPNLNGLFNFNFVFSLFLLISALYYYYTYDCAVYICPYTTRIRAYDLDGFKRIINVATDIQQQFYMCLNTVQYFVLFYRFISSGSSHSITYHTAHSKQHSKQHSTLHRVHIIGSTLYTRVIIKTPFRDCLFRLVSFDRNVSPIARDTKKKQNFFLAAANNMIKICIQ